MTAASEEGCTSAPRRRLRSKVPASCTLGSVAEAGELPANTLEPASSSTASRKRPRPLDEVLPGGFVLKERHPEYVVVRSALDEKMLQELRKFLARKRPQAAKMKNEGGDSDEERKARYNDRDSRVAWFDAKAECSWLHDRFAELTRCVANREWPLFKVDASGQLLCEYETTQYAVYGANQHFRAWHQDAYAEGNDPEDARQITIVAMVTPRSQYTGGQFQVKVEGPDGQRVIKRMRLDEGDAVIFPAKRLIHRVSAVKSGVRKTLVFWAFDRASCKYHQDSDAAAAAAVLPA